MLYPYNSKSKIKKLKEKEKEKENRNDLPSHDTQVDFREDNRLGKLG